MPVVNTHFVPNHGLQIEETAQKKDKDGVLNLYRYWWAMILAKHAKPNAIWDLGCGCGYGSRILVADGETKYDLYGFDHDDEALKYAHQNMSTPRTKYNKMSLDEPFTLPSGLPPTPVDMMICFHIIEFLRHRDIFMEEVVSRMPKKGIALFSTVVRDNTDLKPSWDKHHINFSMMMFKRLLSRYFRLVCDFSDPKFPASAYRDSVRKKTGEQFNVGNDLVFCQFPITLT